MKHIYLIACCVLFAMADLAAGNPDRQGEAGAAQLLLNPWAPSAGLHSLNTANVYGAEAMRINPAGIGRRRGTNVMLGYSEYLQGTGISQQALGVSSRGEGNGAISFSLHSLSFGDVPVTTTDQPDGTGAQLNLNFLNVGLGYSYTFDEKVSVGAVFRVISEGTAEVSSFGFAIDAGIQYATGENDEFKFGLSLRNLGSRMSYGGSGLNTAGPNPDPRASYNLTYEFRDAAFELPSMMNIGISYDFLSELADHRITGIGNFTSNSFSRDQLGAAVEYAFREQFIARVGYRSDFETDELTEIPLYDGLSAGASVRVPFTKSEGDQRFFSVDYGWRNTRIYGGTHNIGLSIFL